ncbi:MAG: hypothetical protein AAF125_17110, partial [Chloroflexota bacterium]
MMGIRRRAVIWGLIIAVGTFGWGVAYAQDVPAEAATGCEAVRFLMARDATPYDLSVGGGVLVSDMPVQGAFDGAYYADFWTFEGVRPRDEFEAVQPFPVTFTFDGVSGELEFALYKGMIRLSEFAPLNTTQFNIERDGLFTIVVRRPQINATDAASYTLTVSHNTEGTIQAPPIPEINNTDPLDRNPPPTAIERGVQQIDFPTGTVLTHAGAASVVNTRTGATTQLFFPNQNETAVSVFTAHIGGWADDLRFLGGDLALRGSGRTYYLQDYAYNATIDGINQGQLDLQDITYGDETRIQVDWDAVAGVWVLEDCAGVKLTSGQTLITPIDTEGRDVSFRGPQEALDVDIAAPNDVAYSALIDWRSVREAGEVTYDRGVFALPLLEDRQLTLQTTDLTFVGEATGSEIGRVDVTLADRNIALSLDWVNMGALRVLADVFEIDFRDPVRAPLVFSRPVESLLEITAQDDVLRFIY